MRLTPPTRYVFFSSVVFVFGVVEGAFSLCILGCHRGMASDDSRCGGQGRLGYTELGRAFRCVLSGE